MGCWHGKWEIRLNFSPDENPWWLVWWHFKGQVTSGHLTVTHNTPDQWGSGAGWTHSNSNSKLCDENLKCIICCNKQHKWVWSSLETQLLRVSVTVCVSCSNQLFKATLYWSFCLLLHLWWPYTKTYHHCCVLYIVFLFQRANLFHLSLISLIHG